MSNQGPSTSVPSKGEAQYELPFYLIDTKIIGYKIFNPKFNTAYSTLLKDEKENKLREKHPRYDRPVAAMFVNRGMIEDSLWAVSDEEGFMATDDPELAAYVITESQKQDPRARFHPFSKKMSKEETANYRAQLEAKLPSLVPAPREYNLKPKNNLKFKGE